MARKRLRRKARRRSLVARSSAELAGQSASERKGAIADQARAVGFDGVGFAAARGDEADRVNLAAFLAQERHGDMTWMATTAHRRADPKALWPEARTIIALGISYAPEADPLETLCRPDRGTISVYARGRDYHRVLKSRLKALGRWIADRYGAEVKVFVDTAPIMEKPAAMRAGLGWIGKHTNLVSRRFGSWLFLGEVLTDLDLPPDPPATDHCGSCDRCLRACPTGALPEPYRIDPRRCISYLTIEHKGPVPTNLRAAMGNRIYGCDDCLAVCPWNRFAPPARRSDLAPRAELSAPSLATLAALDEDGFRTLTVASPIRRTGRARFVRSVLTAIGNSGDPALARHAIARLDDPSPLVREAATSALAALDRRQRTHMTG
ncbi:MAG: tRNA epoxyqueuosine(34) reductase QueG [Rhodospirillales bacterium]|nr:MAG: tRNA epoxyqueuosine(34) reductase QueG [Rhodospirillales bacterium]